LATHARPQPSFTFFIRQAFALLAALACTAAITTGAWAGAPEREADPDRPAVDHAPHPPEIGVILWDEGGGRGNRGGGSRLSAEGAAQPFWRGRIVWNVRLQSLSGDELLGGPGAPGHERLMRVLPEHHAHGGEGWTLATGWSISSAAVDPRVVFANLSYLPRNGEDGGLLGGTDVLQYGIGTAFAVADHMSFSLTYLQRYLASDFSREEPRHWPEALRGAAPALSLGMRYGSAERSIVTSVETGLDVRAPEVLLSVRFTCCF
jgi:hypothetical protein